MGTHISKVKSINLDNWTPEQIEHFCRIGNKRANEYFNPRPELHTAPRSDRDVERFIRDKYERRLFVDPHNGVADPTVSDANGSSAEAPGFSQMSNPQQHRLSVSGAADEASALTRLREMGFPSVRDNHAALKRFNFNVDAAAAYLRGESPRPRITQSDARVQQLAKMGFDHAGQNAQALELCDGDINRAIELLLSDNAPPRTTAPAPASAAGPFSPKKTPAPVSPSAKPATAGLLDGDDFFGGSASPALSSPVAATASASTKPVASSNLNDLLGGLSIASAPAPAPAPAPAQAAASTQKQQDLFGDFGDFFSANSPTNNVSSTPVAPQTTGSSAKTAAAPQPSQGGQTLFDNDFIMSLYAKSPANSISASSPATGSKPAAGSQNGSSAADAFKGLDFFM
ncbi:Protein GTS1 [Coemansia asiatica]|nr:Protein GTS1 [Coemansia asiatica]